MAVVMITGSNRGIGLEFVKQWASAGFYVIACCRDPNAAQDLRGVQKQFAEQIQIKTLDVSDFTSIDQLAFELKDLSIDILINNAGSYEEQSNGFGHTDYKHWHDVFTINTLAPYKICEAFVEHVARSTHKKMVCLSSKMGSVGDNGSGKRYIYRTTKAALNMAVKNLAFDLKERGVSIVSLHPGWVQTDMGGPNALITTAKSVVGMRQVIDQLSLENSGRFISYDGQAISW